MVGQSTIVDCWRSAALLHRSASPFRPFEFFPLPIAPSSPDLNSLRSPSCSMPNRFSSPDVRRGGRKREPSVIVAATLALPQPILPPKPRASRAKQAKRWTREEDLLLRKHYPTRGAVYCAQELGRTKAGVNRRAETLGVTSKVKQRWTRKEEAMLRTLYQRHTALALARMLKRTEQSVRGKLHLMGLTESTSRPWTSDEISYLRSHYGRVRVADLAEELGRSTDAVELKAGRLGISRRNKRLSAKEQQDVLAELGQTPYTVLARRFGVDAHTIRRVAERNGYRDRPTSRPWTPEDDAELRRVYGTMKRAEVAQHLNRTMVAVACRAKEMGLTKPRPRVLPLRNWTKEEDRTLQLLHGQQTQAQLAEMLGRTLAAVAGRMVQLGLRGKRGPRKGGAREEGAEARKPRRKAAAVDA